MAWIWVLFGLIGAVLIVAVAVLACPVRVRFKADVEARARVRVLLELLDGRVPAMTLYDSWQPRKQKRKAEDKRPPKPRKARHRQMPPPGAVLRLVTDILARIRIRRLRIGGVVGLGDPAATGQLYGAICTLKYGLPGGPAVIDVVPDFGAPRFQGRAEGVFSVRPLALVPPALRVGLHVLRGRT